MMEVSTKSTEPESSLESKYSRGKLKSGRGGRRYGKPLEFSPFPLLLQVGYLTRSRHLKGFTGRLQQPGGVS